MKIEFLLTAISVLASVICALAGVVVKLYKQLQKRNDQLIELALAGDKIEILETLVKSLQSQKYQAKRKTSKNRSSRTNRRKTA